ncbi:MAG: hypothetical protein OEY11_08545 [Gammaproteobacteria bacterium]|nr:hypothetical protein [Gammaproteobacteria bacterium]
MQPHTKIALYHWNQLIQDACEYANIELKPETQGYLLLTLVSYIKNESLAEKAIALDLRFESEPSQPNYQQQLKAQADHSLILAGLFPAHIARQSYRISHYIKLGSDNYQTLSDLMEGNDRIIYRQLAESFVELVDILHIIRCFNGSPAMPLIQAMELWSDTGSKTAYQILTTNRQSIPLNESLIDCTYRH